MMKQNNIYRVILSIAKNLNTITLLSAAVWAITSCTDEELAQVSADKAGQLHIASVNVGDNKVASRAEGESGSTTTITPGYNEVVTEVSSLTLNYSFVQNSTSLDKTATATKNDNTWSVLADEGNALRPSGENEKWEHLRIVATNITGEGYTDVMPTDMGISSLNNNESMRIYQDKLFASNDADGGITVTTDLDNAQLGEMSITLKHVHALLHLPKSSSTAATADDESASSSSSYTVEGGIYVQNGVVYQVVNGNPLLTLWAELKKENESIYVPLTTTNDVLQAIVPAEYTLTAFKAVLKFGGNESENFVLDLPISVNGGQLLSANTQYNLNLTLTPREQKVELQRTDKPGWGDDVTLQQSHEKNLQYVEVEEDGKKKFVVNNAQGLQELNKWMNETGGDNVKYIEGYEDVDQTVSRLSHDIHIAGDINLPSTEESGFDLDGTDGSKMSNWIPLGTSETPYTGTITAADDAEITGLEIHVNTNNGGFVGYLGEEGKIEGLKLQGNFSATNATHFGAVAGYNNGGTISGCVVGLQNASDDVQTKVTGTIDDSSSKSYIGGVVGWNNTGLIENCINYATVSAPDYQMVGGVLGENHRLDNCVIKDCKNYGTVTGLQHVGGVVGINHRVVNNCHNEGTVKGKTHVGGVVGMSNDYSPVPDGNGKPGWPIYVINATNKGAVSGEQCVGGVVGSNGSRTTSGGYIVASWNQGNISYALLTGISVLAEGTPAETFCAFGGVVGVNYHFSIDNSSWTEEEKARKGNRTSHVIACYNSGSITTDEATDPKVGGVVGRNEEGSNVWASYYSNPTQANEGCGEELNTGDTAGKEYSDVTDWTNAITAMNAAISKYKNDDGEGYGIVECPSNSEFTGITTTVKTYVAGTGTGAPQLSETATGN